MRLFVVCHARIVEECLLFCQLCQTQCHPDSTRRSLFPLFANLLASNQDSTLNHIHSFPSTIITSNLASLNSSAMSMKSWQFDQEFLHQFPSTNSTRATPKFKEPVSFVAPAFYGFELLIVIVRRCPPPVSAP